MCGAFRAWFQDLDSASKLPERKPDAQKTAESSCLEPSCGSLEVK